jgi:segregation and condensation protein B
MENLDPYIEALIFTSESPLTVSEICACVQILFDNNDLESIVEESIRRIEYKYMADHFGFELVKIAEGYQFLTKIQYSDVVSLLLKIKNQKKLSRSALETLAIIAYQQPISKTEIELIRGVNCDYAVQKLLEKELIQIKGRSKEPGRPILYATSDKFMDHFGLSSLQDLPKLKDLQAQDVQQMGVQDEK